jgi:hypothetical protein
MKFFHSFEFLSYAQHPLPLKILFREGERFAAAEKLCET